MQTAAPEGLDSQRPALARSRRSHPQFWQGLTFSSRWVGKGVPAPPLRALQVPCLSRHINAPPSPPSHAHTQLVRQREADATATRRERESLEEALDAADPGSAGETELRAHIDFLAVLIDMRRCVGRGMDSRWGRCGHAPSLPQG